MSKRPKTTTSRKDFLEMLISTYGLESLRDLSRSLPVEDSLYARAAPARRSDAGVEDTLRISNRVHNIAGAVMDTLARNQSEVQRAKTLIAKWMSRHEPVRFLGAGRALLAGSMPGARLAHAGAHVSFMGGMVPLPNSELGGGIIACSASGLTPPVIEAMDKAKRLNSDIEILSLIHI